jgi:hypothetical protein
MYVSKHLMSWMDKKESQVAKREKFLLCPARTQDMLPHTSAYIPYPCINRPNMHTSCICTSTLISCPLTHPRTWSHVACAHHLLPSSSQLHRPKQTLHYSLHIFHIHLTEWLPSSTLFSSLNIWITFLTNRTLVPRRPERDQDEDMQHQRYGARLLGLHHMDLPGYWDAVAWSYLGVLVLGLCGRQDAVNNTR